MILIRVLVDFRMITIISLFLTTFLWLSAQCDETCGFNNVDLKALVEGIDGKVEPSDPLHLDEVSSTLPDGDYTLTNITLTGMKNCEVIHSQCDENPKDFNFEYHIRCPHLITTYNVFAKGNLDSYVIEGHPTEENNLIDYVIMFNGTYENYIGKDHISRPIITKHTMETDPRGIVKFNVVYPHRSEKEKETALNGHINEHWRETERLLKTPTIDTLMEIFVKNFNSYSKAK